MKSTATASLRVSPIGFPFRRLLAAAGVVGAVLWEDPSDERPSGPLMLQGDHSPVAYRNLRVRPVQLP